MTVADLAAFVLRDSHTALGNDFIRTGSELSTEGPGRRGDPPSWFSQHRLVLAFPRKPFRLGRTQTVVILHPSPLS